MKKREHVPAIVLMGETLGNEILSYFYDSTVKVLRKCRSYCIEDDFVLTSLNVHNEYAIDYMEEFMGGSFSNLDKIFYFDTGVLLDCCLAKELLVFLDEGVDCSIITQSPRKVFHDKINIIQINTGQSSIRS